ncbi:hypothetical protein [Pseudophaeobacter sp. 1A09344]|uniref:hypothetical protein n=1 Tax=Pseudophaeobacter sp. 1A09344 TaxID=3098144 RepID=UPI0034D5D700
MNLSFVIITVSDDENLWSRYKALAAVTAPGDEVLLCDSGQARNGTQIIRRFGEEIGWGEGVAARPIALPETRSFPDRATLRKLAAHPATLILPDKAYPTSDGVKALRAQLEHSTPDLLLLNSARRLGDTNIILPSSDASRWPAAGMLNNTAAHTAAMQLLPDITRVMPLSERPHEDYESAVMQADSIGFVPATVLVTPQPAPCDPTPQIATLGARIAATPRSRRADLLTSAMLQFDDMIAQLDPLYAEAFLAASRSFAKQLPRRLRRSLRAHDGPSGPLLHDLQRRDLTAARVQLALQFAAQDRIHVRALTTEIGRLSNDLDLALPSPSYLMDLFQRARRA